MYDNPAKNIKLGDGLAEGTTMGPLANPRRLDAMEGFVADGAYTSTTSTKTANLISDALEAGMVGINSLAISTPEPPLRRHEGQRLWPRGRHRRARGVYPEEAGDPGVVSIAQRVDSL